MDGMCLPNGQCKSDYDDLQTYGAWRLGDRDRLYLISSILKYTVERLRILLPC